MTTLLLILALPTVIAIILAGALANKRHRAEKKYWRDYDQRNGT